MALIVLDVFAYREGSRENNLICSRVVSAVYHDYGGENKCPWSNQDLKGTSTVLNIAIFSLDVWSSNHSGLPVLPILYLP